MIVRNESASIREVLEAVKPHVDCFTIVDTGSTDGTQDIIREVMAGVFGELHELPLITISETRGWEGFEEFCDFAANRNRALDLAAAVVDPAEFQLVLSGDEFLRDGDKLREELEKCRAGSTARVVTPGGCEVAASSIDLLFMHVDIGNATLPRPIIFRTGSLWHYEDAECGVHEFPAHSDPDAPTALVAGARVEHIVSDPDARAANIEDRHIPLLKAALARDPVNPRALEYLARSYEALLPYVSTQGEKVQIVMEAMALYLRRLALPFKTERERHIIMMNYLDDARLTPVYSDAEVLARAEEMRKLMPDRPEPALTLVFSALKAQGSGAIELSTAQVYAMARQAAQVAAKAREIVFDSSPVNAACEWQAHHVAAQAAQQLARKLPEAIVAVDDGLTTTWEALLRHHVSSGLQAGGDWAVFKRLAEPVEHQA